MCGWRGAPSPPPPLISCQFLPFFPPRAQVSPRSRGATPSGLRTEPITVALSPCASLQNLRCNAELSTMHRNSMRPPHSGQEICQPQHLLQQVKPGGPLGLPVNPRLLTAASPDAPWPPLPAPLSARMPATISSLITASSGDRGVPADRLFRTASMLSACALRETRGPGGVTFRGAEGSITVASDTRSLPLLYATPQSLRERILSLHQYECQEPFAFPPVVGHAPYPEWVRQRWE